MSASRRTQGALFYEFSLEDQVPADHPMRSIDRFVDLSGIRPVSPRSTARQVARRSIRN